MIRIVEVQKDAHLAVVRELFEEYAASLGIDLGFQGFAQELAELPGDYTPPRGVLLLALDDDDAVGCVGLRPFEWPSVAELKRLYVRPQARGRDLGRLLSESALDVARRGGYQRVRLDTLPSMVAAQRMYESFGFREIEAYRFNPMAGTRYMELVLNERAAG